VPLCGAKWPFFFQGLVESDWLSWVLWCLVELGWAIMGFENINTGLLLRKCTCGKNLNQLATFTYTYQSLEDICLRLCYSHLHDHEALWP
jgi:hypothetical protein